jgi:RNA polymerase sigma-70 factor (ECF subfamily)
MSAAPQVEFLPTGAVGGCPHTLVCVSVRIPARARSQRQQGGAEVADHFRFRRELVRLLPRLRRFALTLCRHSADADDLVQMACERAILRAAQWVPGSRLDSWVYTIMRNLWISELRSRRVRLGAGSVDASQSEELSSEIGAAEILQGNQIAAMILSLPEGLAATLLLVSVEGHSYQEAAEVLGIPIGSVMSRMSRARQLMKEKLAKASGEAAV